MKYYINIVSMCNDSIKEIVYDSFIHNVLFVKVIEKELLMYKEDSEFVLLYKENIIYDKHIIDNIIDVLNTTCNITLHMIKIYIPTQIQEYITIINKRNFCNFDDDEDIELSISVIKKFVYIYDNINFYRFLPSEYKDNKEFMINLINTSCHLPLHPPMP